MHRPAHPTTSTRTHAHHRTTLLLFSFLHGFGAVAANAQDGSPETGGRVPIQVARGPEPGHVDLQGISTARDRTSDIWWIYTQLALDADVDDSNADDPAAAGDVRMAPVTVLAQDATETDGAGPATAEVAQAGDGGGGVDPSTASAKELSQQTANPVGKYAFIFTQFALTFNEGDLNNGDPKLAGNITFQPIIPIPLLGEGETEWRIVTRPTINLSIEQPFPRREPVGGRAKFNRENGLSDLLIPLPIALPESIVGRALVAAGPSFSFPTGTDDSLGVQQWTAGVSGVLGYIAENWMAGAYPQYYWRIADEGRNSFTKDASFGNMFYWFLYNITDDWQIGFNPTIQFNRRAKRGNRWNVPVGLIVSRVTTIFGKPFRWEAGVEYSVVQPDDFGEIARFKINLLPIVDRPIKKPLLHYILGR